jgi:hypothetical protein
MSDGHDERQQRGGREIANGPCGDQGERDQLIGDAVQVRIAQTLPCRRQCRHRDDEGRNPGDQLGHVALARDQKLQSDRQDQATGGDERQREPEAERNLLDPGQESGTRRDRRGKRFGGHRGTGPDSIRLTPPSLSMVSTLAAFAIKPPMRS